MRKFNFIQTGPTAGDCTSPYDIQFSQKMTVKEFVEEVLKRHEWGDIYIYDPNERDNWYRRKNCCCTYWGNQLKTCFPDDILEKTIVSASAHGGWSLMDYVLTLEE